MTKFGKNMKLTASQERRDQLHAVLTEGLGCKSMAPTDDFTVYLFDESCNLGVYFVDDEEALSEDDQPRAPWLELLVEDLEAKQSALQQLEVEIVPYARDPEHTYYRLPGGPVFRLAAG